jgi:glycosyltransferase involved in cell wall biosynthesis
MRVAHVTDVYLPALGGIELHVADLARRQAERGDEVSVLTYNTMSRDRVDVISEGGVTVVRLPTLGAGIALDLHEFDQVHSHVSAVSPLASTLAARASRAGIPTLATVHSLWRGLGPLPAMSAATFGLRSAPVVWTAVSRIAADVVRGWLPGGPRVDVLPNAVDVGARARTPQTGPDESVRLVSTMRLARLKRPLPLLRMFAAVSRNASTPVHLTLIGDGGQRRAVGLAIRARGLADTVSLPGRLDRTAVQRVLGASDIYVAPAPLESFGLAALEARCVGLPVVARAESGVADFVAHGRNGLLARSDDDMVEELCRLVDDPGYRFAMAEHNRTTVSEHTWSAALLRTDAAYARARLQAATVRQNGTGGIGATGARRLTAADLEPRL